MNFDNISKWVIPKGIVRETISAVRSKGNEGYELFVFWAGKKNDLHTFEVNELIIPGQKAYKSALGAWVDIPGEELNRLNLFLYKHKLSMPIQVHSHPGSAYHSQRDNDKSILIFPGSISMVIPNFGKKPFQSFSDWAIYQLSRNDGWKSISPQEVAALFEIRE